MKWTTELPTGEGWYWMRSGDKAEIVRVLMMGSDMDPWQEPSLQARTAARGVFERLTLANFQGCEWAGPIAEPNDTRASSELITAKMEAQRLRNALKEVVKGMRSLAEPVGPLSGLWDDIFEYEALIAGHGDTCFDWDGPNGPKPRPPRR